MLLGFCPKNVFALIGGVCGMRDDGEQLARWREDYVAEHCVAIQITSFG